MEQDRVCENCGVSLSGDLSNCPLCGKHVLFKNKKAEQNSKSFPLYNLKFIQKAKWYNIIRTLFWFIAAICIVVNLYFEYSFLWFPYILAGLVLVFHVFIEPVKTKASNYIKNLITMSILVAIFVIFVDAYNHYTFGTEFGWAFGIAAPCTMMGGVIITTIITLSTKMFEADLLKNITRMALVSIVYFIVKIIWFDYVATWPSLAFMCVAVGSVILLEIIKRNKLIKELSKEFHI